MKLTKTGTVKTLLSINNITRERIINELKKLCNDNDIRSYLIDKDEDNYIIMVFKINKDGNKQQVFKYKYDSKIDYGSFDWTDCNSTLYIDYDNRKLVNLCKCLLILSDLLFKYI